MEEKAYKFNACTGASEESDYPMRFRSLYTLWKKEVGDVDSFRGRVNTF